MSVEENEESLDVIVMDIGSGYTKVGYAGTEKPQEVFPTILASYEDNYHAGNEILEQLKQNEVHYERPVNRGVIINRTDIEQLLAYSFQELEADPDDNSLLISEPPLVSTLMREKLTEVVFETLGCPSFYLFNQSTASLFSVGRMTGTVVNCGAGVTSSLPISSGFCCSHSFFKLERGGIDVVKDFRNNRAGSYFQWETLLNESGFVSLNPDKETVTEEEMTLPDGTKVNIGAERFKAFETIISGKKNLAEAVSESIATSEEEYGIRQTCFQNILLTGGLSKTKGLKQRFLRDIKDHAPSEFEVEVVKSGIEGEEVNPLYNVWTGGSVLALLSTTKNKFITKEEFNEKGIEGVSHKISMFEN